MWNDLPLLFWLAFLCRLMMVMRTFAMLVERSFIFLWELLFHTLCLLCKWAAWLCIVCLWKFFIYSLKKYSFHIYVLQIFFPLYKFAYLIFLVESFDEHVYFWWNLINHFHSFKSALCVLLNTFSRLFSITFLNIFCKDSLYFLPEVLKY